MPRTVVRAGNAHHGLRIRRKTKRIKLKWAAHMRRNPTPEEAIMWNKLRMGRLGFKFRRQAIVRGYIADFWCPLARLVVEVDGGSHLRKSQVEWDANRDAALLDIGIETMRFTNEEVREDTQRVTTAIFQRAVERLRERDGRRKKAAGRASREAA